MEYYMYISDSKVEMLYEQIPWARREEISFELGISFGLIKAKFSKSPSQIAQACKVKLIEKHLSKKTGTAISPRSYFRDEMEMIWGSYNGYENFVYFGGKTQGVDVGLGGTMTNCIGVSHNTSEKITSFSLSHMLVSALAKGKEIPDSEMHYAGNRRLNDLKESALDAVQIANNSLGYPKQKLKFLAKKFAYRFQDKSDQVSILIGSPIYVAYAE